MANGKASVPFIFATILLDSMGIGLIIPPLPDVIRRFGTEPEFVNHTFGYFISAYAAIQFIASPILGALSDRFGRRPVLLVSLLGAGLDYVLMAFAPSLWLLFVGRVISGLTGASMTVASSYMADISDDSNRSANFGLIGAAWGIGFILGPLIGGALGKFGLEAPFLAAAGFNLLNFAFGCFVLPESLPREKRRQVSLARLNPLLSVWKVLRPSPIAATVWIYFLLFLSGQAHPSIWTLYTQHRFGWDSLAVGLSLSFVGLSIGIVQGGLTRVAIPRLGENRTVTLGLAISVVSFALFGLANEGWMMYAVMTVFALSGLANPALQSIIARQVPSSEQGELQGSLMSLGSVTAIVGPLFYTDLFARFTAREAIIDLPGAPYLAASIICLVAGVLWMNTARKLAN